MKNRLGHGIDTGGFRPTVSEISQPLHGAAGWRILWTKRRQFWSSGQPRIARSLLAQRSRLLADNRDCQSSTSNQLLLALFGPLFKRLPEHHQLVGLAEQIQKQRHRSPAFLHPAMRNIQR